MAAELNLGTLEKVSELENRVGRLEGAYEHLATKADLERLRADLTWRLCIGMGVYLFYLGIFIAYMEWRVVP